MASTEPALTSLRVDKWLHHVRVFKTRTLAAAACNKSNVTIGGQAVKPAREVRCGDVIDVKRGELALVLKVLALPPARLGAPHVPACCENLTPPENYEKAAAARKDRELTAPKPHETAFKPSKKDLRDIREWLGRD
ncbi:MAG: RNA-binding S4 domain-containing protein [Verrucomicrobiaceae bacterium]|nr:RNA-binding S4 domain-containing protein [Verrucomicrobiaceae bacterium]